MMSKLPYRGAVPDPEVVATLAQVLACGPDGVDRAQRQMSSANQAPDRQTDRQTGGRDRDGQTGGQPGGQTGRQTGRQGTGRTDRRTGGKTNKARQPPRKGQGGARGQGITTAVRRGWRGAGQHCDQIARHGRHGRRRHQRETDAGSASAVRAAAWGRKMRDKRSGKSVEVFLVFFFALGLLEELEHRPAGPRLVVLQPHHPALTVNK